MKINDIKSVYGALPQCGAVLQALSGDSVRTLFLQGLSASAAPVLFSAIAEKLRKTVVFILQDADEAGYFYHDLTQIMGQDDVLFFPSSYRRAVKYGQRDAANEILRTEVLSRLSRRKEGKRTSLYIVSCPEAVSELVVSKTRLDERTLTLTAGQTVDLVEIQRMLRDFGFSEVDYVYEPGQFAVRGSIMDVYSFSSEWPFRIDFFGNEIETIRTFEVQDQLSRDRRDTVEIVPELTRTADEKMPFTSFLPPDTLLVVKDMLYLRETVGRIYQEGFSSQAMTERLEGATEAEQAEIMRDMRRDNQLVSGTRFSEEVSSFRRIEIGHNATGTPDATISFNITPQKGVTFTPTKVTLDGYRYGTNGGTINIVLKTADGQSATLLTGGQFNRQGTDPAPFSFEFPVSGISTDKEVSLNIYVYSLDKGKQVGVKDVVISGTYEGTPEEVAAAVLFLAESRYLTGEVLRVNGGALV